MENLKKGYSEKLNVVGYIVSANFLDGTVTIRSNEGKDYVVSSNEVSEFSLIGKLNGADVHNHDVLLDEENGKVFEVVKEAYSFRLYKLDRFYNRETIIGFPFNEFSTMRDYVKVIGNVFELRDNVVKIDFNIKVYKDDFEGKTTFYYACNNKAKNEIDLIKVVFIGSHILKEEEYARYTYTYEEFIELVSDGELKESSPMELASFASGRGTYVYVDKQDSPKNPPSPHVPEAKEEVWDENDYADYRDEEDEEEVSEEEFARCDTCKEDIFDCNC